MLENKFLKKIAAPSRVDRGVVERFIADDGHQVAISKAYVLTGMSRRTYYYKPKRRRPKVNEFLAQRIKRVIDALPYAGYRTVAWLLGENKNTVQRIFQIKGWQVRKRGSGHRPRVQSLPSAASRPNERWATVWCGERHRWCALTLVMDCFTRELLDWRLSPTGNAKAAEAALEEALISRYEILGRALGNLTIRSEMQYTRTVYRYGIKQEFIRPIRHSKMAWWSG